MLDNYKNIIFNPAVIFSYILIISALVSASEGDERPSFLNCLKSCSIDSCNLDRLLKLTGWNCSSDCKYKCMRIDLEGIKSLNERVVQYYGKWPFLRVLGAQEIFSVIFSLGNLLACLYGYFFIYKKRVKDDDYMKVVHIIGLIITCNTWLQSSIFHYRDTPLTEKLDYFSACLFILSTVPIALIRTFELKTRKDQLKVVVPVLVLYLQHVLYMSFIKFNYGYNVKFNAIFGVASNLIWLHWAAFKLKEKKMKRETFKFVFGNILSMLLVTIDFPPLFDLIDMHALWHLSTIPITIMWYKFISIDNGKSKESVVKEE